jgi:hypothetical protein
MSGVTDSMSNRIRTLNPGDNAGSTVASTAADSASVLSATRNPLRGISPLLLPQPGLTFGIVTDPPELVRPEDRQMSSRLMPRDYKPLGYRDSVSSRSFNATYGGRGAFQQFSTGELTSETVRKICPMAKGPHSCSHHALHGTV